MKISSSIEIRATPAKVFYWLKDPNRAMEWMTSVTQTEIIKQTPNMTGTTFREYIKENDRGTEMRGVVTDFVPNKRIAFYLEGDFNSTQVDFTLEEKGEMTQLTQQAQVHFKGMLRVLSIFFGPFFKKQVTSQTQRELARLKELCERDV